MLKKFFEKKWPFIALFILAIVYFLPLLSPSIILSNVHYVNDVTFYSYNVKKSLSESALPLWTPFFYSGRPIFAQPEYHFLDLNFLLILITGNINLAMNYSVIFHFFLAGAGFYLLAFHFTESKKASFVSSLIYMTGGFFHSFVITGNIMVLEGFSIVPFIFLFYAKSLNSNERIMNSIICGIFSALLVFSGGMIFLPFIAVILAAYSLTHLIGGNFVQRAGKIIMSAVIVLLVSFCLSAIKILPGIEFMETSNRGQGVSYEEYLGEPIEAKNAVYALASNVFAKGTGISAALGIAGFALAVLGLKKIKNRAVIFCALAAAVSLLMSMETFLSRLFFELPVFNQTRHIERAVFIFCFAGSLLAGFGYLVAEKKLGSFGRHASSIFFFVVIAVIAAEMILMQAHPESEKATKPESIPILAEMAKDKTIYRTVNFALSDLIGASGYNYYAQKGISEIKGGGGIWFNDYMEYIVVGQDSPLKFYGVLNGKYVISKEKIKSESLEEIGTFKSCESCSVHEAWGPNLYLNKMHAPRFYSADRVILILGDFNQAKSIAYGIMLSPKWNYKIPLILAKNLDNVNLEDVSSVIIVSYPSEEDTGKLRGYKLSGGKLIPDILEGKNSIGNDEVSAILDKNSTIYEESSVYYGNNKAVVNHENDGWLILSERFAYFPGWTSHDSNEDEIPIFMADNSISAVYAKKGEITFNYYPDSYKKGKILSIVSFALIAAYFGFRFYSKKKGDKNKDKP